MKKDIPQKRMAALEGFCRPLNLKFKDISLLDLAFHHRSCSNENSNLKNYNNERLEFLGDSVLGLVAADFLYNDMAEKHEGDLAKVKGAVVSEKALAPIALKFGVDEMLVLGHGEEVSGGRKKNAILADCMEAIIGAYYLDRGFDAVKDYVLSFIIPEVRKVQHGAGKDFKTLLQELSQKKYKEIPVYVLENAFGPDHNRTFFISVKIGNVTYGPMSGKSKKEAEQNVAKSAYNTIVVEDETNGE